MELAPEQPIQHRNWWRRLGARFRVDTGSHSTSMTTRLHAPELIPADIVGNLKVRKKLMALIGVTIVSVAIVGGGAAVVTLLHVQKIQEITALDFSLQEVERELLTLQGVRREQRAFDEQTRLVMSFMNARPLWSRILTLIEDTIPASVVYHQLAADASGTIVLTGSALDVASVDYARAMLSAIPNVTAVRLTAIELGEGGTASSPRTLPVRFELRVELPRTFLYPSPE